MIRFQENTQTDGMTEGRTEEPFRLPPGAQLFSMLMDYLHFCLNHKQILKNTRKFGYLKVGIYLTHFSPVLHFI